MTETSKPLKIIIIGDGMVGKTCLLRSYILQNVPSEYDPTVVEYYSGSVRINNKDISFQIWDTAGQEDFEPLHAMTYPNTDAIILCFSIAHECSFDNVEMKWMRAIRSSDNLRNKPIVLVGTKVDVREELSKLSVLPVVYYDRGKRLANRIDAVAYLECSALTKEGVKAVFDTAIGAAYKRRKAKSKSCRVQ